MWPLDPANDPLCFSSPFFLVVVFLLFSFAGLMGVIQQKYVRIHPEWS
jgi:hypothetical protein